MLSILESCLCFTCQKEIKTVKNMCIELFHYLVTDSNKRRHIQRCCNVFHKYYAVNVAGEWTCYWLTRNNIKPTCNLQIIPENEQKHHISQGTKLLKKYHSYWYVKHIVYACLTVSAFRFELFVVKEFLYNMQIPQSRNYGVCLLYSSVILVVKVWCFQYL